MSYTMDLKDKSVLITGAASGIGLECAKGYLDNGAKVYMADFNEEENNKQANALRELYPEAEIFAVTCDITKTQDIENLVDFIKANTGRVDILLNNAGTGKNVRSVNETKEGWDKVISLNLSSQFFFSQKIATEFLIPQRSGKIVNMASLSAFLGVPNCVAYSASKGAVLQMTKSLAGEWARFNIQVNCVCPGFIDTPLIKENKENEKWMAYMNIRIAQKRLGQPSDVVGGVLFLSSNLADYITGTSIIIDGGYSC